MCWNTGRRYARARAGIVWLLATVWVSPAVSQDCGSTEQVRNSDGSRMGAVAKWDGVNAYAGPSRSTDVVQTIDFGTPFLVYNRRSGFLCLGDVANGGVVGWASQVDFLTREKALKDPDTGIYRKVMVRNNLKPRTTHEWGKFWPHPYQRDRPRRETGIYEVRYVFDVNRRASNGEEKYYFLAGKGQEWTIDNADKILDGWIGGDFVFVWKTRIGVQYKTDLHELVKIFPERDNVEKDTCEDETLPWAFSSLEDNMEWPYDRERFPLIDEANGIDCLTNRQVLKIGAFGAILFKDKRLSAAEGDHLVSTVNSLRGGNQNIDVLFVIDGTESMQPVFAEAKRAVQEVRDLGALADARYALLMFKDKRTLWPPRMTTRLLDADGLSRELDRYMREAGRDVNDIDFAESVLDGLYFGLQHMNGRELWRENSTRAVILLGDHGDHYDTGHDTRLAAVLDSLVEQKTRFFAYQTRNSRAGTAAANTSYGVFQEDATTLIAGMTHMFPSVAVARGDAQQIANALQEMRRWKRRVDDGYEAIRAGEVPPSEVGPYIRSMLEASELSLEEVMGYGRAPQVCHEGFVVLQDSGMREQFEKRVRVSYKEVAELMVAFRGFVSDTSSEQECLRSMQTAFQAATGDRPRAGETPAEFLGRKLGVTTNSDLFDLPFEELAGKLAGDKRVREKLREDLTRSVDLLDAVYREEEVEIQGNQVNVVYEEEGYRPKRQLWFKTMQDGTRVAWIPTYYIP